MDEDELPDYDAMTDEELDALDAPAADTPAPSDDAPEAPPADSPAPQVDTQEQEATGDQPTQGEQQPTPAEEPRRDGAVAEAIAQRKRAQEAEARAAEAEERANKLAAQSEQDRATAKYNQLLATEGEEAAEAFAKSWNDEQQRRADADAWKAQVKAEADATITHERVVMSQDLAIQHYGNDRYMAAYNRLAGEFGADWVYQKAAASENPGRWVVEFHDTKLRPPAEVFQAEVKKEAESLVAVALGKKSPPPGRAATATIAHVSGAGPASPSWEGKDPDDMTDAELRAAEAEDRKRLYG
jgi:hypothetical protein